MSKSPVVMNRCYQAGAAVQDKATRSSDTAEELMLANSALKD
jgi:hypothetical protein